MILDLVAIPHIDAKSTHISGGIANQAFNAIVLVNSAIWFIDICPWYAHDVSINIL